MAIQVRKDAKGKPRYRVQVAVSAPGTVRRNQTVGTFSTKREAERAERDALQQRDRGTLLDPSTVTVATLLDDWLRLKSSVVSANTLVDYGIAIRLHLKPSIGTVIVQKLTTQQVQRAVSDWETSGVGARTIHRCLTVLSQALTQARSWNIVIRNVAEDVERPRLDRGKPQVWTPEQVGTFLEAAINRPVLTRAGDSGERRPDALHPLWHLLVLEGLRRGEALGLRWSDVNWERRTIHLSQTVAPDKNAKGAAIILPRTKTAAGSRTVRLTERTYEALRAHKKAQNAIRLAADEWEDHDLVICTAKGTPVNPNNVSRSFSALIKAAGVPPIRVHDLRHTAATVLLLGGVPAKVVSERLGHATVTITMDLYSHILPDMQDAAAAKMDELIPLFTKPTGTNGD